MARVGDFNEIGSPEERVNRGISNHGGPSEFISKTNIAEIIEMPSIEGDFTWTNNQVGLNFIQSKLDRAFTNQKWIETWPETRVDFHVGTSDHKAMVITFSQAEKGTKPLRIFNFWLEDPTYVDLVRRGFSINIRGTGLFKLQQKLKEVKALSKEWAVDKRNSTKLLALTREKLESSIQDMQNKPNSTTLQKAALEKRA